MDLVGLMLLIFNAMVAAVLLQAGLFKMATPAPLRRALAELLSSRARWMSDRAVRAGAAAEIMTAVALLVPQSRVPAGVAAGVLGATFVSAGVAGRLRRGSVPCGCLASGGRQPLGRASILLGLAIVAVAAANILEVVQGADYAAGAPVTAALFTLLTCLWVNRAVVLSVLRPKQAPAQNGAG
jgi:Methylamine utilisation protein MauE